MLNHTPAVYQQQEALVEATQSNMRDIVLYGNCLQKLAEIPDGSVQTCVTSPPYWGLRDYGVRDQLGAEKHPKEYIAKLVAIFDVVRRKLCADGTLWLNLGDTYLNGKGAPVGNDPKQRARRFGPDKGQSHTGTRPLRPNEVAVDGFKQKDLMGIPWRVAFALQDAGWYLRSDIIWNKPNCMPESVEDRPTRAHEYVFLLAKSKRYFYDEEAVREPLADGADRGFYDSGVFQEMEDGCESEGKGKGKNRRSVWNISTKPYRGAHFAVFPPELPELCIRAGSKKGQVVLDPFSGSGTTLMVAKRLHRAFIGIELNEDYRPLIEARLRSVDGVHGSGNG